MSSIREPEWNSEPAWKLPGWAEPVIVACILFGAMFMTRRRNFRILRKRSSPSNGLGSLDSDGSSEALLPLKPYSEDEDDDIVTTRKHPPKKRSCCCFTIHTPNTARFRDNIHSRILQRFPFLVEMLYWIVNYAFYRFTAVASQHIFAETGIWNVAQAHGLSVLETEHNTVLHFLLPVRERSVQQWFMHGHQGLLTVLNKAYALIHIPGTVGFICWYYYVAPSFDTFAMVRRTMTLTNFCAFLTFIFYPCMPPRLLPREYGFLDTVRHDNAESVWMSGKYINTLAAMPSMHFGYAFCIGATLIFHSGLYRRTLESRQTRKPLFWKVFYLIFGLVYPAFILVTIVATANHYWLDAMVATAYVAISFLFNRVFYVFIPLEDLLLFAIRADKPVPTTGDRFHENGGRI
ncbi:uncharacterized protein EI97DRAFT_387837 [Westerdykella ornata]|uniref:Inositolphosphotransferase Aur1/Ipt1 domain-containing protein n=1 Tax=Westerdykella ornata TaxID=318751 RepID=A0A6A6J4Y9_WESOR|nr:uncharacterized protein EI97DRAFT_387837 [Westerdykella ornata]KAF2271462.1 hypothetical protein EI97DRAFT_387837 [Westerdykella ornata]